MAPPAAASEENYARWKLARDEVLARASHPSISGRWRQQTAEVLAAVDLNATPEEIR